MIEERWNRLRFDYDTVVVAHHAVGIAAFVLVYAFLLRGIEVGQLYAFGDFPPYYRARAFAKFTGTWHDAGLGYPYIYNALPAYLGVVTAVGGAIAQNLFYLALLPTSFLTFFVFVGRFVDSLSARYLAAGVYAVNPLTIGEFVNGAVSALIGFVGLPLVLHFLYATVERDRPMDPVAAGVVFGATTVSPWLGFWMVVPFAASLAVAARRTPRTLGRLVGAGALGVALTLPSVHHVLQRAAGFDEGRDMLVGTLHWNYAFADPLLVLRLGGNRGVTAMNELGYNTEPAMIVGLVIPAIGLLAWHRRELHAYYAIAVGIVTFVVLTAMGATYWLFDAVPLLYSVRNPVKLQFPLLVCLSVLFGAGTQTALIGSRAWSSALSPSITTMSGDGGGDHLMKGVLIGVLTLSLVSYAVPAVGAFGLEEVRGDDYYVDDGYEAVADDLDGRALWVPYGYQTQLHLRHTYPDHVGIKSGGVAHGIPNVEYVKALYRDVAAGRSVHGRLDDLGVRYVVVESDPPENYGSGDPRVVEKWGAPWLFGDPGTFENRLRESDAYEQVGVRGEFIVYRVVGVPARNGAVERNGIHAVFAPTEPTVEPIGDELIQNTGFDDGFDDWWVPPNTSGRETQLVESEDGPAVMMSVDATADRLPLAQSLDTRPRHPYRLSVDVEGAGTVTLVWFDGGTSPENRVGSETVSTDATPSTVVASGNTLAVRVRPNASSEVVVKSVSFRRATYPPATGVAAADGVPGVAVDGRNDPPATATVVAVNLDREAAEQVGADVRIVDAETVADGRLVFDETYRQGVGVRLDPEDRPDAVPAEARAVTDETADGRIVDYWVVGEFDDTPVTVLYTSYDERWRAGPDAEHFVASGWANGFTNAEPADVHWTGAGDRETVVRIWLALWALTVGGLGILWIGGHRRRSRESHDFDRL